MQYSEVKLHFLQCAGGNNAIMGSGEINKIICEKKEFLSSVGFVIFSINLCKLC